MNSYIRVHLEWYEVELGAQVGVRRQIESLKRGSSESTRHSKEPAIDNHVESSCAEKAVAKYLNIDWPATINTFQKGPPDCGRATEVRWRRFNYELKVRPNDPDERFYVLARGALPDYLLIGWMRGRDAKRPEWLRDYGNHGERAHFVPDKFLNPMCELRAALLGVAVFPEDLDDLEEQRAPLEEAK